MDLPLVDFKGSETVVRNPTTADDDFPHGPLSFEEIHSSQSLTARGCSDLEEHEILTSCGVRQRVYVRPSQFKRALVTYHDIGTNHISFLGFFNHPCMRVITKHFTVYHVCAPGHHENAPNEVFNYPLADSQVTSNLIDEDTTQPRRPSGSTNTVANYPSLDQLAQMLTSLLVHFRIDNFVGFGMGAGSNVLARYALHHPDKVLGLFLLNPSMTSHSYYQRFMFRWWEWSKMEHGCLTDSMLEQLDNHWFGYGLADNEDIVRFYHELARSLNPANLAGYINAYMNRTALTLVRPVFESSFSNPADTTIEPTVIRADVYLVTGARATDHAGNVAEMNGCMDPKCTQFICLSDCTGMVMEENPDKLAVELLHFLRSIGLVITLTPDKLREQATALQLHQLNCAYSVETSAAPTRLDLVNEA